MPAAEPDTINLTSSANCEWHQYEQPSARKDKKTFNVGSAASFERKETVPGRYMEQAKETAIRRRHKLVARQGELIEKEHLYDC